MEENKNYIFKTLVKNGEDVKEHWRNNDYVLGRISGMNCAICGKAKYPNMKTEIGIIIITKCDPEKYVEFTKMVKEHYPGLCEFNYKEN